MLKYPSRHGEGREEASGQKYPARHVRHEEAAKAFLEAAKIFAIVKDNGARAESLLLLAAEEDSLGKDGESRRSLDKARSIFHEAGDKKGEAHAIHKLATLAERDKKWKRARSLLGKARELYLELDRVSDAAKVLQHINALPE